MSNDKKIANSLEQIWSMIESEINKFNDGQDINLVPIERKTKELCALIEKTPIKELDQYQEDISKLPKAIEYFKVAISDKMGNIQEEVGKMNTQAKARNIYKNKQA
jgi:hypothetical protein